MRKTHLIENSTYFKDETVHTYIIKYKRTIRYLKLRRTQS